MDPLLIHFNDSPAGGVLLVEHKESQAAMPTLSEKNSFSCASSIIVYVVLTFDPSLLGHLLFQPIEAEHSVSYSENHAHTNEIQLRLKISP